MVPRPCCWCCCRAAGALVRLCDSVALILLAVEGAACVCSVGCEREGCLVRERSHNCTSGLAMVALIMQAACKTGLESERRQIRAGQVLWMKGQAGSHTE